MGMYKDAYKPENCFSPNRKNQNKTSDQKKKLHAAENYK